MLSGVVGNQNAKLIDGGHDLGLCVLIGLKKALITRDDETAPADLGILQHVEHISNAIQNKVCVRHQLAGIRERIDAAIGQEADHCHQHKR